LLPAFNTIVKNYPENHPVIANACYSVGYTYFTINKYDEALNFLLHAFKIWRNNEQMDHPDLGHTCVMIANIYLHQYQRDNNPDLSMGLAFMNIAEENISEYLPDDHPRQAGLMLLKARFEYQFREFDLAIELCEKAIEIMRKKLPADHNEFVYLYHHIAQCYVQKGLNHEAISWYEKALAIFDDYKMPKKLMKSRDSYEASLPPEWKADVRFPKHDFAAQLYLQVAASYLDTDKIDKAIPLLEKSAVLKNTTAMLILATIYDEGKRLKRNSRKALEYYQMYENAGETYEGLKTKINKLEEEIKPKGILKLFRK